MSNRALVAIWLGAIALGSAVAGGIWFQKNNAIETKVQAAEKPAGPVASAPPIEKKIPDPIAKISAPELVTQYSDNAAKADGKYRDKWIEVSINGKVKPEGDGYVFEGVVMGSAAVSMAAYNRMSDKEKDAYNNGYPPSLFASFSAAAREKLQNIDTNKTYLIRGFCRGSKHDANVPMQTIVRLDGCVLIGEKKDLKTEEPKKK